MRGAGLVGTISAMNPRSLRLRRLVPARLRAKVRQFLGPKAEVSQARLKGFRKEMDRRPPVRLPGDAPKSVTVVVPCFGHAAFLPDMFESIVAQTHRPDEVIFVDDCSPDETSTVLAALIATQRGVAGGHFELLANDRNMGQAASLNRGIAAAKSELIMVLNDDDYLMHDAVEAMLALFDQHREVALIGAHSIHFAGHEALVAAPERSTDYAPPGLPLVVHRPADVARYRLYNDLNMTHSASCFRKVAWEAVGGYRPDKTERVVPFSDRDFQLRINVLWPAAVAERTPYSFWRHDSSVDAGRDS
jgi:glycosyltransferase involved in cell wall biosynthesis